MRPASIDLMQNVLELAWLDGWQLVSYTIFYLKM